MSSGATEGSSRSRTHSARSLICISHRSAIDFPRIFEARASGVSRVPSQSGHGWKVTARSTKRRTCGCMASGSLDSIDFWIFGMIPSNVRLTPSTLILVGSAHSIVSSCFLVNLAMGLSMGRPTPSNNRPYHPSIE